MLNKQIHIQTVYMARHHTCSSTLRLTPLSHKCQLCQPTVLWLTNNVRHKTKACDTRLPLLSTCFDSLPHFSRVLAVYDDENSSDVSKPEEYEDFSGPYLITSAWMAIITTMNLSNCILVALQAIKCISKWCLHNFSKDESNLLIF